MIWIPDTQLTISICLQSLLTFHKAVRARQSSKSARAAMGNIMQKLAKTCHFWNQIARELTVRSQFLYHGWKEHELEIRFHTTLTRTKWNKVIILASKLEKILFFWWRHFCLCSIEIIPLTDNRFSPRFWYVVAETILYKKYDIYFSFWWRHHSEIFD